MTNKNYLPFRDSQEPSEDDVIIEDLGLVIPKSDITKMARGLERTRPISIYEGSRVALIVTPDMVISALAAQNARHAEQRNIEAA